MKYLLTFALINVIILTALAQGTVKEATATLEATEVDSQEALTSIAKIEIQDLDDGTGAVKVWIRSTEVKTLDYLSMQFSGQRIPRSTVISTLKLESAINASDGTYMILMQSKIVLNASSTSNGAEVRYAYKKSGPRNFRNIKPGQVLILPPIEK